MMYASLTSCRREDQDENSLTEAPRVFELGEMRSAAPRGAVTRQCTIVRDTEEFASSCWEDEQIQEGTEKKKGNHERKMQNTGSFSGNKNVNFKRLAGNENNIYQSTFEFLSSGQRRVHQRQNDGTSRLVTATVEHKPGKPLLPANVNWPSHIRKLGPLLFKSLGHGVHSEDRTAWETI